MMLKIARSPLPDHALLGRYRRDGHYTDCFSAELPGFISHQRYIEAFYTTWLFKAERIILRWVASKPSTDLQAAQLASGHLDSFAAWKVEGRATNQLLLTDYRGATRSWLMVAHIEDEGGPRTRLYFGSAVLATDLKLDRTVRIPLASRSLLGFHRMYSVALLWAAARRLRRCKV